MEEEKEYLVYKTFFSIEEAEPILELLQQKGIEYQTTNYNSNIGSTFASTNNPNKIEVRLLPNQFEVVDTILEQEAAKAVTSLPADHYMHSLTEDELMEVLEKPDEWTKEDYLIAQQLLRQHGKVINQAMLDDMWAKRMELLSTPETGSSFWIAVGYISAFCGGFLGILMGWYMMSQKKTLPNGESIYVYNQSTRTAGRQIFFIGIASLIIALVYVFVRCMPHTR
jgi:hypothetical protein